MAKLMAGGGGGSDGTSGGRAGGETGGVGSTGWGYMYGSNWGCDVVGTNNGGTCRWRGTLPPASQGEGRRGEVGGTYAMYADEGTNSGGLVGGKITGLSAIGRERQRR